MFEKHIGIPQIVGKDSLNAAILMPICKQQNGKDGFQKGAGKEEQVSSRRDPNNSHDLTFGGHLVDGSESLEDCSEAMGKDGNFYHANHGDGTEQ